MTCCKVLDKAINQFRSYFNNMKNEKYNQVIYEVKISVKIPEIS